MPRNFAKSSAHWDELNARASGLWLIYYLNPSCEAARAKLVEHYAPLAARTGNKRAKWCRQRDHVIDQDDLTQELVLVLYELVQSFDPEKYPNVPFHKYAAPRLALRVVSVQRDAAFVSRHATARGVTATFSSIDAKCSLNGMTGTLAGILAAPPSLEEERAYEREVLSRIKNDRHRQYAELRWFRHRNISEIGQIMGFGPSRAYMLQRQVLPKLLVAMGRRDLDDGTQPMQIVRTPGNNKLTRPRKSRAKAKGKLWRSPPLATPDAA